MLNLGKNITKNAYPIIAIRDGIVFPATENVLVFGRNKSVEAMKAAMNKDRKVVLLMQRKLEQDNPKIDDLYTVGVLAEIDKIATGDKGQMNALVKGMEKVKVTEFTQSNPYFVGTTEAIKDTIVENDEILAIVKYISGQIKKAINLGKTIDFVFLMNILNINSSHNFSNQVAMVLDLKTSQRQELLEETDLKKRLSKEVDYINKEIKVLELEHNISNKTQKKFEKNMRETFLREKMKTIEEELGDKGESRELDEYKKKITDAGMPKDVEEKAVKELKRLAQMSQYNPEASYIRSYLDWLVEIPWKIAEDQKIDIKLAETILNEDHFGLKKVKERILEFLAVMKLKSNEDQAEKEKNNGVLPDKKKEQQPSILCFVGPPGVGKTSLGRSIARALDRKFVKISLGGIRDEAEIRGHRRTYVGALPGRMIQAIKQAGTKNPVFMLDEIDKIGRDYRGDPSAALLEALDPEQNHSFSDHYLEVPYDLSDVFFITTANILDTIPDALLDRLEVIHFAGYTEDEKFNIAKNYLIPKQRKAHHIPDGKIKITDEGLHSVVRRYTREAGVRELERQIATIFRKIARDLVENKVKDLPAGGVKSVGKTEVEKYLGPYKYSAQMIEDTNTIGITTGLAWTQAGGDILFIEVAIMPGKGNLTLTGNLGDVMKESCQAALSYIRARWDLFKLDREFYNSIDVHVHVPEGAVPKDGPSAGGAIVTSIVSALTKIPVKRDVAMTGEITLRGRVTEIGGLKEKVIAAHRAGIKKVIIPKENKKDMVDIPEKVKEDLKFVFVDHIDQVVKEALAFPNNIKIFRPRPQMMLEKQNRNQQRVN